MAIYPKLVNFGELTKNFRNSLKNRANITNFNSDSSARSMYLPFANELNRINKENRRSFESMQIDTATGKDLDAIAANFGLVRNTATFAESFSNEKNFIFTTEKSFGVINSGNAIIIPAGTDITFIGDGPSNIIMYTTTETAVLEPDSNYTYVSIRSKTAGAASNVDKNTLRSHSFTDYTDFSSGSLKCINLYPILNGSNNESDDSLRFRIVNAYASFVKDSEDALFLRSLEIPGLVDARVIPNYYGVGTVAIFVFGAGHKTSSTLLAQVERKIDELKAPGIKYIVMPGISVLIDLDISIYVEDELDQNTRDRINQNVRSSLKRTIEGGSQITFLSFNSLKESILNSDSDIKGVISRDGKSNLFRSVYIRKTYGDSENTSERYSVTSGSITLEQEEYFSLGIVNIEFEVQK